MYLKMFLMVSLVSGALSENYYFEQRQPPIPVQVPAPPSQVPSFLFGSRQLPVQFPSLPSTGSLPSSSLFRRQTQAPPANTASASSSTVPPFITAIADQYGFSGLIDWVGSAASKLPSPARRVPFLTSSFDSSSNWAERFAPEASLNPAEPRRLEGSGARKGSRRRSIPIGGDLVRRNEKEERLRALLESIEEALMERGF